MLMKNDLSRVRYLLVDLDGTLVDARMLPLRLEFIRRTLRSFSRHGGWYRAVRALSALNSEMARPSFDLGPESTNISRSLKQFSRTLGVSPEIGRSILEKSVLETFPVFKRHFFPVPGASSFLTWAKERYSLTLATNPVWPSQIIRLRVEWAGLDPSIFKMITHGDLMHACKPHPQYYEETLSLIGANASNSLLVGNDFRNDLPATRVGIPVFLLSKEKRPVSVRQRGLKTPAWRGSFEALKNMLESASQQIPATT
jgi:FMN phosphatase YigB (HAD superfamily)